MPFDRFLIAPINTGLVSELRPWLIPDDAFTSLSNAYVFRGRIRKRFGGILMGTGYDSLLTQPLFSRLRLQVNTTDGSGNASGIVPGHVFRIGRLFSIGDEIFTVYQTGAVMQMLETTPITTATFSTTNGAYNFVGATANTPVYFYPAEPVMGLANYEVGPINDQPSYAFDTQFGYVFAGGAWLQTGAGTLIFHGDNTNFFWTTNWSGLSANLSTYDHLLFVSNFQVTNPNGAPVGTDDPIWYFDGTNWFMYFPFFAPAGGAPVTGPFVQTSRLIVIFKNRLLLLNTIETNAAGNLNTNFQFRCRYSINGSPFSPNAWYEYNQSDNAATANSNFAGAGYIDATTEEAIITAEFIKDRLIVYFERSTWEIVYTGNQVTPFVWQKINTELGAEATFSVVPFDKVVLGIGNTGVHACNGSNVERIDNKIPQEVFDISNRNEGVSRVVGIRDYYTEMVYWTFPTDDENAAEVYPNRVLVYNYKTGSWAFNDDCITMFGYFEQQQGRTWANSTETWNESNFIWQSGTVQANFRQVIAGNQQGFVFIVDSNESSNARVMQLTNIVAGAVPNLTNLIIIDHTLSNEDYIMIEESTGITSLNGMIFQVFVIDADTVVIDVPFPGGMYTGGGTIRRVSNLNIITKQFNPYVSKGRNVYVARIDFCVGRTAAGQVTVDYTVSSAEDYSMVSEGTFSESIMGTSVLETSPYTSIPLETLQQRLWHPVYFQTDGEFIQFKIYMSATQIMNPVIAFSDFELEGFILHTQPTSQRLQ